jgi:hypothetical protein
MSKFLPFAALAAGLAGIVAYGCLDEPAKEAAAFSPQSFATFADRWERYHKQKLVANAQLLAKIYDLKVKNPDVMVANGKQIKLDPMMSASRAITTPMATTPAFNMFESHVSGQRGALLGNIDPEAARLRLWVEDAAVNATWHLFRFKKDGSIQPYPLFSDTVGPSAEQPRSAWKVFSPVVESAWKARKPGNGKTDGWTFATRFLKYSDQSCLSCHKGKKIGDVAAIMVYAAKPNK